MFNALDIQSKKYECIKGADGNYLIHCIKGNDKFTTDKQLVTFSSVVIFSSFILLGVHNWNKCPIQPWLPKFLIVQGSCSITMAGILLGLFFCCDNDIQNKKFKTWSGMVMILVLGQFIWQGFGCKWLFVVWSEYEKTLKCDYNTFVLTLSFLIIVIIEYFFGFVLSICLIIQKNIKNQG